MSEIFVESILSTNIQLKPQDYNKDMDSIILEKLKHKVEGKCDKNGYIKPGSVEILSRSMGQLLQAQFNGCSKFKVWYKILTCNPVEGMVVKCSVLNRNKMGLFCELYNHDPSPLTIILAKQHHLKDDRYEDIKIGSSVDVEIVGIKFEYNDTQISCIGRLHSEGNPMDEEDNEEEEYYKDEDDDEMEIEEELVIPNIETKPNEKPKSLIDLMTSSTEEPEEKRDDVLDLNEELEPINLEGEKEDNDDLGLEFEGEMMNLEEESQKNRKSIHLTDEDEQIEKLTFKVYKIEIKKCEDSKFMTLVEPAKDKKLKRFYIEYYNYSLLNNMLVDYFEANKKNPATIYINEDYQFKDNMIKLVKGYLSHMIIEETEENTYVI
jgi:DNA-directed RNA polymerase subunit E'/Rpb7